MRRKIGHSKLQLKNYEPRRLKTAGILHQHQDCGMFSILKSDGIQT